MKIKNKLESMSVINKLNLNKFPEEFFRKGEEEKVLAFINKYPAKYYAIRDKSSVRGNFKLKVLAEDILKEIKDYQEFTINISSYNYIDNQLLNGEIAFFKNGEVYIYLSSNDEATGREESGIFYEYSYKTDIFDKRLNDIPLFDYIYEYVVNHNLMDAIVELSIFDKNVGINNEQIIIYEVRTDY